MPSDSIQNFAGVATSTLSIHQALNLSRTGSKFSAFVVKHLALRDSVGADTPTMRRQLGLDTRFY
jgi:hypothetical protein